MVSHKAAEVPCCLNVLDCSTHAPDLIEAEHKHAHRARLTSVASSVPIAIDGRPHFNGRYGESHCGQGLMQGKKALPNEAIHREGYTEGVVDYLRAEIISLRIPPDTRISIDSLARKLGVSQTPIREALRQLEAMGLVTKQHYAGYCSAPKLSRRQLDDLYEIRLQLEPYAARRAAERIDEQTILRLRKLAAAMQPAPTQALYDQFAQQDSQLHDIIAAASGNRIIHDTLERLHLHFHIFRLRFHHNVTAEAVAEHALLVDALARHDPAAAEQAMRVHIERSYQRLAAYAADDGSDEPAA